MKKLAGKTEDEGKKSEAIGDSIEVLMEEDILLAKFLGSKKLLSNTFDLPDFERIKAIPYSYEYEMSSLYTPEEMEFNTSYDWIMKVFDKILSLEDGIEIVIWFIDKEHTFLKVGYNGSTYEFTGTGDSILERVHSVCVAFVKFYNEEVV